MSFYRLTKLALHIEKIHGEVIGPTTEDRTKLHFLNDHFENSQSDRAKSDSQDIIMPVKYHRINPLFYVELVRERR